jgi:3-methyladenine DNA glycosylase AlkD
MAGPQSVPDDVDAVIQWLEEHGTKASRDAMARYAIPADNAFGIPVGTLRREAKRLRRNHGLAAELWATGWYEARMLAAFIDEPARVTPGQMDRWCREFDSWAICDTVCMHLFDRTPHAWAKVAQWSTRRDEFVKRAAFALLASLAQHDKAATDAPFLEGLVLIERVATDDRNFVKKAVNWALRGVGERSAELHAAALVVARRLATSPDSTARWVGRDAERKLTSPVVMARVAKRSAQR